MKIAILGLTAISYGAAAVFFEGEDPSDLADKLFEVLSNPLLREALSHRGVGRAKQFSWPQGAARVYRIIEQLAPAPHAVSRAAETTPPERRT